MLVIFVRKQFLHLHKACHWVQQSLKIIARYSIKVDGAAKTRKLSTGAKLFVP